MGHHIMSKLPFKLCNAVKINIVAMGAEFLDLLLADIEPTFSLRFGECDPEVAPSSCALKGREKSPHALSSVAGHERVLVFLSRVVSFAHAGDSTLGKERFLGSSAEDADPAIH
jgi:hypothetical protein